MDSFKKFFRDLKITLVEYMIVMAIIGILISIAVGESGNSNTGERIFYNEYYRIECVDGVKYIDGVGVKYDKITKQIETC